jgi:hypothetical protein
MWTMCESTRARQGFNRDSFGGLYGYAWSTGVGWVKFYTEHGEVNIDPAMGSFDGYAWPEHVGWIHFENAAPTYNVAIRTHRVNLPLALRE